MMVTIMVKRVAVVIPKYGLVGGAEGFAHALTERLAVRDEFEMHVLANRYRRGDAPVIFHQIPMFVFPRFLRQISFAFFVDRHLKSRAYHVVHSHDRIFKMDLFTFHGIPHETWTRRMRNKRVSLFDRAMIGVEKRGLSGPPFPTVLPVSTLVKAELQKCYPIPDNHVRVIHPGVSEGRFFRGDRMHWRQMIRRRHGIGERDPVILFVGMNFEIKRLGLLMEGISELSRENKDGKDVKLLVVGRGNTSHYMAMARDFGLKDRVVFAGVTDEVEKYYAAGDVFAMPSVYDTFGMVVLEAMACGLPVIITRTVGAGDLVRDGVEGFVLDEPPTAAELGRKIGFLLNDPNRLDMGAAARKRALKHTWDRVAEQVASLYLDHFKNHA